MIEGDVLRFRTGEVVTVLQSSRQSGGALFEFQTVLPPHRAGPPAHLHLREEEQFTVVQGRLAVRSGELRFEIGPGESALVPPNTPHTFANRTNEPVTFITRSTPAGILEEMLRAGAGRRWWPLLRLAELNHGADATFFLAGLPLWPQRVVLSGLAGVARLRRR